MKKTDWDEKMLCSYDETGTYHCFDLYSGMLGYTGIIKNITTKIEVKPNGIVYMFISAVYTGKPLNGEPLPKDYIDGYSSDNANFNEILP